MKRQRTVRQTSGVVAGAFVPVGVALAQASPFEAGTTAFQASFLTMLTPVAVIAVMVLGVAALFSRISWSWVVAGIAGIALGFGAPQVVDWVRGLFGV